MKRNGNRMGMNRRKKSANLLYHILMILLSIIMVYPFLWSALSSFKPVSELYVGSPLNFLPQNPTMENFNRLFEILPFGKMLFNSIFLSVVIPIGMIIVSSFTAYALARLDFKGRNIIFILFIAVMMVPSHVTTIPNYKTIIELKLINSYWALFLTSVFTAANSFNIFFFRQYFLTIPKDLENAAVIDGCSRFRVFIQIIMPNSKPAIATTAILSFRSVWNQFLFPMLVISDYDRLPITVGLKYLKEWEPNWAVLLAGSSLSIIPIVIVYLIFQKYFLQSNLSSGFGGT
ncbi:MAG TPA: carbohydrate ABC transporter permease [Clostridiales bacterium]|nr:carbohydrate ABC transporter permease [Clostridiales bacterium]